MRTRLAPWQNINAGCHPWEWLIYKHAEEAEDSNLDEVCHLAPLITSTQVYLQGRAREISLRCNDTKQVRNASASQCVVAHLPPTVIPLSVSPLCFPVPPSAVICSEAKREYQMPFFSLTCRPFILSSCLCARSWNWCARRRENIVLLASAVGAYPCWRGTQMVTWPRMWSPISECVGVNR